MKNEKRVKYIIEVCENEDGNISEVKIEGGDTKSKSSVIEEIKRGENYKTKTEDGKIGSDVHIVSNSYIRTDGNEIKKDNLGELKKYKCYR